MKHEEIFNSELYVAADLYSVQTMPSSSKITMHHWKNLDKVLIVRLLEEMRTQHKVQHCAKKPLSTILATSKNVLFPDHNHLLTTGADARHSDYRPSTSE